MKKNGKGKGDKGKALGKEQVDEFADEIEEALGLKEAKVEKRVQIGDQDEEEKSEQEGSEGS